METPSSEVEAPDAGAILHRFLALHPEDATRLDELRRLLTTTLDLRSRKTLPGHLTASGLIFDPRARRLLLVRHRALGRWLQPGGHVDAGESPLQAARREVLEEVGLGGLRLLSPVPADESIPVDIDSHAIPANAMKGEPAHTHHDFRYAFLADSNQALAWFSDDELAGLKWVSVDPPANAEIEPDLRRSVARLLAIVDQNGMR